MSGADLVLNHLADEGGAQLGRERECRVLVDRPECVVAAVSAREPEERRVGKECSSPCRSRWSAYQKKKTRSPARRSTSTSGRDRRGPSATTPGYPTRPHSFRTCDPSCRRGWPPPGSPAPAARPSSRSSGS